jgi:hypothetical protein
LEVPKRGQIPTVSNLVDCLLLLPQQLAIAIKRLLLKEETNLVSGGEKIIVSDVIIVTSSELSL